MVALALNALPCASAVWVGCTQSAWRQQWWQMITLPLADVMPESEDISMYCANVGGDPYVLQQHWQRYLCIALVLVEIVSALEINRDFVLAQGACRRVIFGR